MPMATPERAHPSVAEPSVVPWRRRATLSHRVFLVVRRNFIRRRSSARLSLRSILVGIGGVRACPSTEPNGATSCTSRNE